jgi:hypothetical protein
LRMKFESSIENKEELGVWVDYITEIAKLL